MTIQFNVTLQCDEYSPSCKATVTVPVYKLTVETVPGEAKPEFNYNQLSELGWSQEQYRGYGGDDEPMRHYCPEHTTKRKK